VPIWSLDILPTVLAVAGLPLPREKPLDGKNILPALTGEVDRIHDHLFWTKGGSSAVRSGRWKLVTIKGQRELFDLDTDPGEFNDLADENPRKVAELSALYEAWFDEMAKPVSGQPKRRGEKVVPRGDTKPKQD
jgi:uncharacterized sulfatase